MRGAAGLGAEARSPGINGVGADGVIAEIINKCGSWYFESIYFLVLSFFFFFLVTLLLLPGEGYLHIFFTILPKAGTGRNDIFVI